MKESLIPDYSFYTDTYLGSTIDESEFDAEAIMAYEDICSLIYPRTLQNDMEVGEEATRKISEFKRAVCAQAEMLYTMPNEYIISEKSGDYSAEYNCSRFRGMRIASHAYNIILRLGLINRWV